MLTPNDKLQYLDSLGGELSETTRFMVNYMKKLSRDFNRFDEEWIDDIYKFYYNKRKNNE